MKKWILSINLGWAPGTIPLVLRAHFSIFTDFIPIAKRGLSRRMYGGFTKGLR